MLSLRELKTIEILDKYSIKYGLNQENLRMIFNQIDVERKGKITQDDLVRFAQRQGYTLQPD